MKQRFSLFFALWLSLAFHAQAQDKLTVYAAASMTNVVSKLVNEFEQQRDVSVTTVFGGSSSLARQIAYGAPADVFISANHQWVQYLIDNGSVEPHQVKQIAANQLVVIAKKQIALAVGDVQSWQQALNGQRLAVGQTDTVPAGIYAKQALTWLGVWKSVEMSLAPSKSVRATLALVERGETPLGIVYKTDAMQSETVTVVATLSERSHEPIQYPAAVVSDNVTANEFLDYLQTRDSRALFTQYGFLVSDAQ